MNSKKMKVIRRRAKEVIVEWLQSLLPEHEKDKVTIHNVMDMMPKQTHYVFQNQIKLSAWSYKWVVKKLKQNPDLTFTQLDAIIKGTSNIPSHIKRW
jgi:hypothetical protein